MLYCIILHHSTYISHTNHYLSCWLSIIICHNNHQSFLSWKTANNIYSQYFLFSASITWPSIPLLSMQLPLQMVLLLLLLLLLLNCHCRWCCWCCCYYCRECKHHNNLTHGWHCHVQVHVHVHGGTIHELAVFFASPCSVAKYGCPSTKWQCLWLGTQE